MIDETNYIEKLREVNLKFEKLLNDFSDMKQEMRGLTIQYNMIIKALKDSMRLPQKPKEEGRPHVRQ